MEVHVRNALIIIKQNMFLDKDLFTITKYQQQKCTVNKNYIERIKKDTIAKFQKKRNLQIVSNNNNGGIMNTNKRIVAFDLLKIIACLAVITIHISAYPLTNNIVNSPKFIIATIFTSITRWSVPIFVMITGAFLLSKREPIPIKTLYKKYILKIFIIYLLFGVFYKLCYLYLDGSTHISVSYLSTMIIDILIGNAHIHLWYLYMLIGLYMIYPIIHKLVNNCNKRQIEYALIIIFLASSVTYTINEIFTLCQTNYKIYHNLNISIYIFYFIAGYYLYNFKISKKSSKILMILIPMLLLSTITLSILASTNFNRFTLLFVEYQSLNTVVLSISVFYLFKVISNKMKFSNHISKIITLVSDKIMVIYLLHMLVIDVLTYIGIIKFKSILEVILIPVYTIFIFIICIIIIFFVKVLCKVFQKGNQSR